MDAIISDIHSNIEALDAVYADMADFGVDRVLCLGDVIGYGPNPREVLAKVKDCAFILMGNHEEGLLLTAENFNERARSALEWTRDEISSSDHPKEDNYVLWEFIDSFLEKKTENDLMFVHGSPRGPIREYVMPADALDRAKMTDIFEHMPDSRASFGGHTHVPGVFVSGGAFRHQSDLGDRFKLPEVPCLVNVGSVGQPRDGDKRASYVLIDGDELIFRRVEYDYQTTMRKIAKNPKLDDFLARRLRVGQ